MAQRKMAIEDAVRWAYRDELPKAVVNGGRGVPSVLGYASSTWARQASAAANLGSFEPNRYGVIPAAGAGEPHPAALMIGDAVEALDDLPVVILPSWSVPELAEAGALGEAAIGRARAEFQRAELSGPRKGRLLRGALDIVRAAAILGPPDGRIDPPALVTVKKWNGKDAWFRRTLVQFETGTEEVEVDGYDARRKRPHPDAYRKFVLDPDPTDAIVARARYQVWRSAMDVLHDKLVGTLPEVEVSTCMAPWAPWASHGAPPRLLADLSTARADESLRQGAKRGKRSFPLRAAGA